MNAHTAKNKQTNKQTKKKYSSFMHFFSSTCMLQQNRRKSKVLKLQTWRMQLLNWEV